MQTHGTNDRNEYRANEAICVLERTRIISIGGNTADVSARVVHELYPQPRLVVECSAPLDVVSRAGETLEIVLSQGEKLSVLLSSYNPSPPSDARDHKDKFVAAVQPCVTTDRNLPIRTVRFLLVNFVKFYGPVDTWRKDRGRFERVGRLNLKAAQWIIEVRAISGLDEEIKTVQDTHGYCVTHKGTISRVDGGSFSSSEASELVRGLEVFLSFARSRSCGIVLVNGFDDQENVVWSRWGAPHVTPGAGASKWLKRNLFDDDLAHMFPTFWQHYGATPGGGDLANVIDWYLNSAEASIHVGIILSQVALESLASYVLRRRKGRQWAAGFIHDAFVQLRLQNAVTVTRTLPNLYRYARAQNCRHGSQALAKLRNDLVHSNQMTGAVSDRVLLDAHRWARWCVELSVLKLLGFKGEYWNSVEQQLDHVP